MHAEQTGSHSLYVEHIKILRTILHKLCYIVSSIYIIAGYSSCNLGSCRNTLNLVHSSPSFTVYNGAFALLLTFFRFLNHNVLHSYHTFVIVNVQLMFPSMAPWRRGRVWRFTLPWMAVGQGFQGSTMQDVLLDTQADVCLKPFLQHR